MIKYLFVCINGLILFLYNLSSPQNEPELYANFPQAIVVNHEVVVEFRIKQSELIGFASLQLVLPAGFTAREMDSGAATFSVQEGQVTWTWQNIESEQDEMVLSLGITANQEAIGKHSIGASFYYILNNEKKSRDMTPAEVEIMRDGEGDMSLQNAQVNADTSTNKTSGDLNHQQLSHAEPSGTIEVSRSFSSTANAREMLVEVSIRKGITKGFARYSDILEPGFSARALRTDGGSFSLADGKVKFVWVSVPEKEELKVCYVLIQSGDENRINLKGEYSYLEHNQSKKASPADQTLSFTGTATASVAVNTEAPMGSKNTAKTEAKTQAAKSNTGELSTETRLRKQDMSPRFEVQIGAFTKGLASAVRLKKKFGIRESIRSEMADNFSKFMVGKHQAYKEARKHRDEMVSTNGVKSSFVVAYHNGKRITVQEALMISNQKWFK